MVEPDSNDHATRLTEAQSQWLAEVYEANFASVLRACRSLLRDREEAADAAHEVFLRAVRLYPLPNPPHKGEGEIGGAKTALRPWLVTVARNHCRDLLRRRSRFQRVLHSLSENRNYAPDPATPVVDRQVVAAIVGQLGQRERKALWQSAVERQPLAAIARDFKLSYMAAAQLVSRARRRAAVVGARLAGIFALFQGGRILRRITVPVNAQVVAGIAAVPLIVVVLVPAIGSASTTGRHLAPIISATRPSAAWSSHAGATSPHGVVSSTGAQSPPGASLSAAPAATVGTLKASVPPALGSTLSAVQGTVTQLSGKAKTLPAPSLSPLPAPSLPALRP
jgi:RNA polymerase sigma factor (sigma-70 family)